MKKVFSNVFLAAALAIGTTFMFSSCSKPCKDVVCENGGTEVEDGDDCLCDCVDGYEGSLCQTEWRSNITGSYNATESCTSGSDSYGVSASTSATSVTSIVLNNLYDAGYNTNATMTDSDEFTINSQTFGVGTISGTGTINGSTVTINYTVTVGTGSDSCTITMIKQ